MQEPAGNSPAGSLYARRVRPQTVSPWYIAFRPLIAVQPIQGIVDFEGGMMVRVHHISKEDAQNTRKNKTPGMRRQRMSQFDEYAQALLGSPNEAAVYEELGENPQKFVLSLRGAFKRAGAIAVVRKMRGRDEVRVWLADDRPPARRKRGGK